MSDKSISHDDALRRIFAEEPDFAMAYVNELRREVMAREEEVENLKCVIDDIIHQVGALEAENADLKNQLKAALEKY